MYVKSIGLSVLIALAIITTAPAETIVPGGNVYGTWTAEGSPYEVQGNIVVPADSSLIIEPAVQVYMNGYGFDINGSIEAIGTETDSINFTNVVSGNLRLLENTSSGQFMYCRFTQFNAICIGNCDPVFSHCTIYGNNQGFLIGASNCDISDCVIQNAWRGISLFNPNPFTITRCIIENTNGAIFNDNHTGTEVNIIDCVIRNNVKPHDPGAGIISNGGTLNVSGCSFFDNEALEGYGGAIACCGAILNVTNCVFKDNSSNDNSYYHLGGGAIALYGADAVISYSLFSGHNDPGSEGGAICLYSSNAVVNNCSFCSDSIRQVSIVNLRENSFADIIN